MRPKPRDYLLSKILEKDEQEVVPAGVIDDPIAKLLLGMKTPQADKSLLANSRSVVPSHESKQDSHRFEISEESKEALKAKIQSGMYSKPDDPVVEIELKGVEPLDHAALENYQGYFDNLTNYCQENKTMGAVYMTLLAMTVILVAYKLCMRSSNRCCRKKLRIRRAHDQRTYYYLNKSANSEINDNNMAEQLLGAGDIQLSGQKKSGGDASTSFMGENNSFETRAGRSFNNTTYQVGDVDESGFVHIGIEERQMRPRDINLTFFGNEGPG